MLGTYVFLLEGNYRDMFCCYFEIFVIVTWRHAMRFLAKEKREEYQVSLTSFFFRSHGKLRRNFNINPKLIWNVTGFRENAEKEI